MKSIEHEMRYDGATPEQVYAMLSDPAFRAEVCEFQHFSRHDVDISQKGSGMSVHIDQYRPASGIPGFAQKFVGDELHIRQEEEWSSSHEADLHVGVPGKPGAMEGTVRLVGDDAGTTETVRARVKVSIPLVGGKIEAFAADMLLKALRAEHRVGQTWLGRQE